MRYDICIMSSLLPLVLFQSSVVSLSMFSVFLVYEILE